MISRVTHQTVQRSTLRNLQTNLNQMARLQGMMSSGTKIQVPSDDPAAAGQSMHLRATERQLTQYTRNAQDGDAWLTTIDSALTSSLSTLRRARNLVVQSGDGGMGPASLEAIAVEIDELKGDLLSQANTRYQGRTVFAGTSDAGVAFTYDEVTGDYAWTGSAAATVERRVGATTTLRVDSDGSAVYGDTADNVFALLDGIVADLRAGVDVTDRLDAIDDRMQKMLTAAASNGSRQSALASVKTDLTSQTLTVKSQRSDVEDIDLAEVIMNLQMQEVAYQGALSAGARVLQPSLLDFLQ